MAKNNAEQLKLLAEVFNTDKIITSDEIEQVLKGIVTIMNSFKSDNEKLNAETKSLVSQLLRKIKEEKDSINDELDSKVSKADAEFKASLAEAQKLIKELKSIELKDGEDGKDADEEMIIDRVLERIEFPEYEERENDDGDEIINKINNSEEDSLINASKIRGWDSELKNLNGKIAGLGGSTARNLYQLIDVNVQGATNGQALVYQSSDGTWIPGTISSSTAWGEITGTLTDQTDLTTYIANQLATQDTLQEVTDNGAFTTNKTAFGASSVPSVTVATFDLGYKTGIFTNDGTSLNPGLLVNNVNTSTVGSTIIGAKARGSLGSESVVSNGDKLLTINALGFDGTDYAVSSQIVMDVSDGTPGAGSMGGRIRLYVSDAGSESATERFRINQTGIDLLGTSQTNGIIDNVGRMNVIDDSAIYFGASNDNAIQYDTGSDALFIKVGITSNYIQMNNADEHIIIGAATNNSHLNLGFTTGISIGDGADEDIALFNVLRSTDTPQLKWDDSETAFSFDNRLRVIDSFNISSGVADQLNEVVATFTTTGAVSGGNIISGFAVDANFDATHAFTDTNGVGATGVFGKMDVNSTSTVSAARGVTGALTLSAGTVTTASAVFGSVVGIGSGTTTNAIGGNFAVSNFGTNVFTNAYGIKVEDITVGGTTNYAIYTGAGAVRFGGSLDVTGTTTFRGNATYQDVRPQIVATSAIGYVVTEYSNDANAGQNVFQKARGTEGTPLATNSGDNLGAFSFRGYTGSAFTGSKAFIAGQASETWTPTANGTRISFSTTPNGSTTLTEAMRINNNQSIGIGTTATTPYGKLEARDASGAQIATSYDTSNYMTITTGSAGSTTFDLTGTSPTFTFNKSVSVVGNLDYDTATGAVSALGNLGATEAVDWSTATHFTGTLDSNVTITHTNEASGQKITLALAYDGAAQRTITWSDVDVWEGGSAPTTPSASGETLVVTLMFLGTTCYGSGAVFS